VPARSSGDDDLGGCEEEACDEGSAAEASGKCHGSDSLGLTINLILAKLLSFGSS
jgi:hypothetical protein